MRKRLLSILLAVCLMVGMVPLSAMAAEEVASGTCGKNEAWAFDADTRALSISSVYESLPTGSTIAKGDYMDDNGDTQHYEVTFDKPLPEAGGELPTGNYYLPGDITLAEDIVVNSGSVKIDLAGHVLRGSILVRETMSVEIYDSDANEDNPAKSVHYYHYEGEGDSRAFVFDGATPSANSLTGGCLVGGSNISSGGLIALFAGNLCGGTGCADGPGSFFLYGGKVVGYTSQPFYVSHLLITGGVITENKSPICVAENRGVPNTLTMLGGEITSNLHEGIVLKGGSFTMKGGAISNNGGTGVFCEYTNDIIENAMVVGSVSLEGGAITGNKGYGVCVEDNSTITMNGGVISGSAWGVGLKSASTFTLTDGEIRDNTQAGVLIANDASFTMAGGEISGTKRIGVDLDNNGSFTMTGGVITGNQDGVYMTNRTAFIMKSGEIRNNTANGVIVALNSEDVAGQEASIVMSGGKISGNGADGKTTGNGGGVRVMRGTFTMTGGEISGNQCCGLALLRDVSGFKMTGGTIADNEEPTWSSGGIYTEGGTGNLTMELSGAPVIARNRSKTGTANVFLAYKNSEVNQTFTLTDPLSNTERIGIDMQFPNVFTHGWSTYMAGKNPADYFVSERSGYGVTSVTTTDGVVEAALVPIHTVTYGANGGTGSMEPVTIFDGEELTLPESAFTAPESERFKAWSIESTEYAVGGTVIITADTTVSAVWETIPTRTVTFDANGGTGTMEAVTILDGEELTLPECAFTAPESKRFKAWSIDDSEYAVGGTVTITANTTVSAVWEPIPSYHAVFVADGVTVETVSFQLGDSSLSEPAVPAKAHYDGAWESYDLASATGDITINAVYTLNNDHQYADTVTAPTCTEQGYTTHTCSICGDSYTDSETTALGHDLGDWEETKAPTCTEKGSEKRTCSRCDYSETREIALANHTYTDTVTAPTCTEQGYTTHTCSVCGDKAIDTATPALGHDYQKNEEKSVAAERGKDGYDYFECSRDPAHFYTVPVFAPIITHTATFVVGEKVIGVVTFEEGSTTLEEPELPERKNYVGQWENYDLANAKTDIIIHGQYTPVDPDKVSDVESGAETEYANGVATITLTAAAASKTIKVVSETTTPVDVVLVLDQSGSMAENLSRYDRQSKRDALVGCAKEFVQSLYENAKKTGADHRVAVTGFAYSAYNRGKYENTGLLATPSGNAIKYDNIADSDYQSALLLINNGGEINQNVLSGIDSIVADGATAADLGLRMASNIFAENPTQGKRQRIVIFITDGTPTSWNEEASLIRPTAADAISIANNIKNGQDGKIYCVGVHANADSAAAFTSDKDGVKTDWFGNFVSYDFNRFLHAVSSNYPDSKSMDSLDDGDKNGGYYMAVNDTGNLGNIFTNILYSTVYELKTFDKAAFHYTLPAEFTLTIEQEMALREELKKAHGITDEDIVIERKPDGTTELQFSNIPTKEAYDETGALVYQATVTFKVTANQKANGSTGTGSGDIQYGDSTLTEFTAPTVEVPADRHLLVFKIGDQVYQITEAELGDSITVPDSRLASWQVAPGTVVDGDYTVFEATTISDTKYNLTWSMNGTEVVQQYQFGEAITPPDPSTYALEGCEFSRWSRSIPATMPAYNLECTAIYSPAHVHEFVKAYQTGDCDTGITTIYRCACGEEKSEQAAPEQHNYTAVFSDNGYSGNTMEKLVCTKCGHSEEKNITFKVAYSESRKTTVLDLSLYENQVSVSEPDKEIELRFYIGGEDGKRYTITRIDPDGKRTKYQGVSENGYLVFKADHFSIYVIGELDEAGQETEQIDYEQATEILDSKVDATEPEKPTPPTSSTPSGGGSSEPDESDTPDKTWENPYTDISSAKWYYESVRYVAENGLMTGFGGGKFGPGEELTRAQLAQVLYNREGKPAVTAENEFADVVDGAWYSSAVIWAADNDIVSGYGNNKFGPDDSITREQLATILWRSAGKPETAGNLDSFTDRGKASDWAVSALRWAVEQKIISGKGNGILDPKGRATRAEVAAMLMRYCELGE